MPYKPTGRPPGRPRYLPPFEPEIPAYLVREFPSMLDSIEQAVKLTQAQEPNADLLWLNIARSFRSKLFASHRILAGHRATLTLSAQQLSALQWLQRKGKHNWQKQLRDAARGIFHESSTKAKGSKGGR